MTIFLPDLWIQNQIGLQIVVYFKPIQRSTSTLAIYKLLSYMAIIFIGFFNGYVQYIGVCMEEWSEICSGVKYVYVYFVLPLLASFWILLFTNMQSIKRNEMKWNGRIKCVNSMHVCKIGKATNKKRNITLSLIYYKVFLIF